MTAPHSLATVTIKPPKPPVDLYTQRFGSYEKGAALPETQVPHSPRRRVADFPPGFIKLKWIEQQEQNQLLQSCCRHPENHEIEARKSHPDELAPDIYIFYCSCGNRHIKFCVGQDDVRPEWR